MRTSAVQHVLDALKKDIQANYRVGDVLPNERELSERFGVSRNTIREAVIFLEAYKLVEKTQRGARVRQPDFEPVFHLMNDASGASADNMRDVLAFRRIVETGALSAVIEHAQDTDIDAMEAAMARMDRAMTVSEAAQADHDFHAAMLFSARNGVLTQLYTVMSRTLIYYLEIGKATAAYNEKASADHARIVQALRARSLEALQAAVTEHFDHSEAVRRASTDERARRRVVPTLTDHSNE